MGQELAATSTPQQMDVTETDGRTTMNITKVLFDLETGWHKEPAG